jgi:formate dehydrogenase subunit gamma
MSTTKRRRKMKYIISGSIISIMLVLVLPLIPYAISASADNDSKQVVNPIEVPNPGTDLWRDVRQRDQHVVGTTQVKGVDTGILISKRGESWRQYRMEKLVPYSAYLLGAIVIVLLLYRMYRGQIKVEGGLSGQKLFRFNFNQRTAHWLVAVLFIVLALTGIVLLYGRFILIPLLGPEGFSVTALVAKRIHDFAGPLFAIALIMMFLAFVKRNLLKKIDLDWFLSGGGFMVGKHVGSGYFNAGEKAWFWLSVLGGALIVVTGLTMDFPVLAFSRDTLELSHLLHTISGMLVLAVALGHIYMGTVGVEGAYEAMATGYCDANWAKEHHDVWYKDMMSGKDPHADLEEGGESRREQPASSG